MSTVSILGEDRQVDWEDPYLIGCAPTEGSKKADVF